MQEEKILNMLYVQRLCDESIKRAAWVQTYIALMLIW